MWYWKELLTLISLVLSFLLIIPFCKLLLNFPYFKGLIQSKPKGVPQPIGVSKYIFWSLFFLSGLIACFSFIQCLNFLNCFFGGGQKARRCASLGRAESWVGQRPGSSQSPLVGPQSVIQTPAQLDVFEFRKSAESLAF